MLIYDTPNNITAFSTTRDGGVSIDIPRLVMPQHQTHDTVTAVVDEAFLALNPLSQALSLDGVDALCTNLANVCVGVKTADCIPVLLWDNTSHVVSVIHAGWKGTVKRIVEANIDTLVSTYGIHPENLHAIIAPGIGLESFEVGDEVYQTFADAGFPMDKLAKKYPLMHKSSVLENEQPHHEQTTPTRWHIDLWECNRLQLINKGVNPDNIHVSGIDTYTNHNRFFSARRKLNGRIINGIMLSE